MKDSKLSLSVSNSEEISDNFLKLSPESQAKVIDSKTEQKRIQAGLFGKIFGTETENISRFIAFLIAFILLLVVIIYLVVEIFIKNNQLNNEFLSLVLPVFTLILGYIFGHK